MKFKCGLAAFAVVAMSIVGTPGVSFANSVLVTPNQAIPDNNPGGVFIDIPVSDTGTITSMSLVIGANHTFIGDLLFRLQSPTAQTLTVLNRPGFSGLGFGDNSNLLAGFPISFLDGAANDAETMGNALGGDQVVCRDDSRCSYFPNADADPLSSLSAFAGFLGSEVNGTWRLFASDNALADTGSIVSITLNYTLAGDPAATPLPAALPLFVSGLGALGLIGWRKRRRAAATE